MLLENQNRFEKVSWNYDSKLKVSWDYDSKLTRERFSNSSTKFLLQQNLIYKTR